MIFKLLFLINRFFKLIVSCKILLILVYVTYALLMTRQILYFLGTLYSSKMKQINVNYLRGKKKEKKKRKKKNIDEWSK